jgi:hypothetical protein
MKYIFFGLIIFIIVYLLIYNLYLFYYRKKNIDTFINNVKRKCTPSKYIHKTKSLYVAPLKNKNGKYSSKYINDFNNINNFKGIFSDYEDRLKIKEKYLICGDNKDKKKSRNFGFIRHSNPIDAVHSKNLLNKNLKSKYKIQYACPNKHKNDPILCSGSDKYIK